jgi:hypothetical protein
VTEVDRALARQHTAIPPAIWTRLRRDGLLREGVPTP